MVITDNQEKEGRKNFFFKKFFISKSSSQIEGTAGWKIKDDIAVLAKSHHFRGRFLGSENFAFGANLGVANFRCIKKRRSWISVVSLKTRESGASDLVSCGNGRDEDIEEDEKIHFWVSNLRSLKDV